MSDLVNFVQNWTDRPVLDETYSKTSTASKPDPGGRWN